MKWKTDIAATSRDQLEHEMYCKLPEMRVEPGIL
jgi:hypothetical protein